VSGGSASGPGPRAQRETTVKRTARVVAVTGLALVLLGLGGLGLFLVDGPQSAPAVSSRSSAALFGPTVGGRALDRTIASLQARLQAHAEDWRSHADLGLAYLQKGRLTADPTWYTKAEAVLTRSLSLNKEENIHAALGMGVLNLARHEFEEALHWGRQAKALDPYESQARGVIGDALVELGRYAEAVRAFQEMIDLRPDLSSYARVSYARELHGDVTGAIAAMKEALAAAGGSPEDAAWVASQLGDLYLGNGRVARAEREYRRGAYLAPEYVLPEVGLAKVAAVRGHLGEATEKLAGVVDRYPAPEFVILLGDLYRVAGRDTEADQQYELVRAMQQLNQDNGVNTDLEMALFNADHGVGLSGAVDRARAEYRRRQSIHSADALAWTLYGTGRYRDAARYAKQALRLGTRDPLLHFHAGMIAFRLGHRAEATQHLSAALTINPHFSFLHRDAAVRTLDLARKAEG
jgi:tetratricopeptide (TPR) repeat protein